MQVKQLKTSQVRCACVSEVCVLEKDLSGDPSSCILNMIIGINQSCGSPGKKASPSSEPET